MNPRIFIRLVMLLFVMNTMFLGTANAESQSGSSQTGTVSSTNAQSQPEIEPDPKNTLLTRLTDPKYTASIVAILLIIVGMIVLITLKADSPLTPYILQILGLTFLLPIILLISIILELKSDAVVGLLGTVVGYIFGTSNSSKNRQNSNQNRMDNDENNSNIKNKSMESNPK